MLWTPSLPKHTHTHKTKGGSLERGCHGDKTRVGKKKKGEVDDSQRPMKVFLISWRSRQWCRCFSILIENGERKSYNFVINYWFDLKSCFYKSTSSLCLWFSDDINLPSSPPPPPIIWRLQEDARADVVDCVVRDIQNTQCLLNVEYSGAICPHVTVQFEDTKVDVGLNLVKEGLVMVDVRKEKHLQKMVSEEPNRRFHLSKDLFTTKGLTYPSSVFERLSGTFPPGLFFISFLRLSLKY